MQEKHVIIILCLYGFFIALKPSEPHIFPFLSKIKGFSHAVINRQIYPFWTYSYFASLIPLGILAEIIGYKAVILVGTMARLATRSLLLWGHSLGHMQLMQMCFGIASSEEVIYFSYVYTAFSRDAYQKLTSYTRASVLLGHVGAGLLGQIILHWVPLITLFYISFFALCAAMICATIFMFVKITPSESGDKVKAQAQAQAQFPQLGERSTLEESLLEGEEKSGGASFAVVADSPGGINQDEPIEPRSPKDAPTSKRTTCRECMARRHPKALAKRFLHASTSLLKTCRNPVFLILVLWWVLTLAGHTLALTYATNVFTAINPKINYNGYACAAGRCAAAVFALIPRWMPRDHLAHRVFLWMLPCMVIASACCFAMGFARHVWLAYAGYILYYATMQFIETIMAAQIGRLCNAYFAFLFSANTFFALAIQTILQAVLSQSFHHKYQRSYLLFGIYLLCVNVIIFIIWAMVRCYNKKIVQPRAQTVHPTLTPLHDPNVSELRALE